MAERPLRIEMVVPTMDVGGMEAMVASLTRALIRRGHDAGITCLAARGALGDRLAAEGVPVASVPAPGIRPLLFAGNTGDWLQKRRPDVLHVHSGVWLKAVTAARSARVPRVVSTCHGLLDSTPLSLRVMMRLAARRTDSCAAVSTPLARFLVEDVGVPARKVVVIENGIDTTLFAPGPRGTVRDRLGIGESALVVGTVARLAPGKNLRLLLAGFKAAGDRLPGSHLVIAGDGPDGPALRALAIALGLADRVHFLGTVTDTGPLYRAFDLFVLPSLAEGTSISLLEAMASGVAAIASDVGGNPALLDCGKGGWLFPSNDESSLADALRQLGTQPEHRAVLGAAARARVVAHYSHEVMVDRYLEQYALPSARGTRPSPPAAGAA